MPREADEEAAVVGLTVKHVLRGVAGVRTVRCTGGLHVMLRVWCAAVVAVVLRRSAVAACARPCPPSHRYRTPHPASVTHPPARRAGTS